MAGLTGVALRRRRVAPRVFVGFGILACGAAFAPCVPAPLSATGRGRFRMHAAAAAVAVAPQLRRRPAEPRQEGEEPTRRSLGVAVGMSDNDGDYSSRGFGGGRPTLHFDETPALLSPQDELKLGKLVQKRAAWDRERAVLETGLGRSATLEEWSVACGLEGGAESMRRRVARTDAAKERMVSANLRLVMSIARRYKFSVTCKMTLGDLIQEGTFGLVKAVERFDPDRGFRFSTYASWWVRQTIMRAIAEQSRTIRLPSHVHDLLHGARRASRELQAELGRAPSMEELAKKLNVPVDKLSYYFEKDRVEPISLSATIAGAVAPRSASRGSNAGGGGGGNPPVTLGERVTDAGQSPLDFTERRLLKDDVDRLLWKLAPRERAVLRMRYGLDDGKAMTLKQVGERFNVTRERIRQIEARALHKLRQPALSPLSRGLQESSRDAARDLSASMVWAQGPAS